MRHCLCCGPSTATSESLPPNCSSTNRHELPTVRHSRPSLLLMKVAASEPASTVYVW
ncbi:Uncharacterised protein [Mycobacteroides abscessus subsp. abscessus]|nr:Uncharacterised protein [Mycobacteroides abscessus subsp. abscessus]